jgi:hypothetical protein
MKERSEEEWNLIQIAWQGRTPTTHNEIIELYHILEDQGGLSYRNTRRVIELCVRGGWITDDDLDKLVKDGEYHVARQRQDTILNRLRWIGGELEMEPVWEVHNTTTVGFINYGSSRPMLPEEKVVRRDALRLEKDNLWVELNDLQTKEETIRGTQHNEVQATETPEETSNGPEGV